MNRRQLFGSLGAVVAASAMPSMAMPVTPDPWNETDPIALVKGFVASKVKAGYPDLFLFKNRSGQFIFQVYDHEHPTSTEVIYLLNGKPDPHHEGGGILPSPGKVSMLCNVPIVGMEFDFRHTPEKLIAGLNKAFRQLIA